MDDELEVIRTQMEEKRASLADKLDALENQVMETVQGATAGVSQIVEEVKSTVGSVTEGVQETVTSVKETLTEGVQDTVETVKQTFNVSDKVRNHPWAAMGSAFALGFAGAYLLGPSSRTSNRSWFSSEDSSWSSQPSQWTASEASKAPTPSRSDMPSSQPSAAPSTGASFADSAFSSLGDAGAEALTKVKELAVGTLMGVLGQVVSNQLPEPLKIEADRLMKDLTTKLGGKVIDVSKIVEQFQGQGQQESQNDGGHSERTPSMRSARREDPEPVGQSNRRGEAIARGFEVNDRSAERVKGLDI